jgi:hypothetical protein
MFNAKCLMQNAGCAFHFAFCIAASHDCKKDRTARLQLPANCSRRRAGAYFGNGAEHCLVGQAASYGHPRNAFRPIMREIRGLFQPAKKVSNLQITEDKVSFL